MKKRWGKILIPAGRIRRRVRFLGAQITKDFAGHDLVVIGVLKGSIVFFGDLIRQIKLPMEVDFLEVSSYGAGTSSSRDPKLVKDVTHSICGKTVLIVDDILDSGHTLQTAIACLKKKLPRQVKTCVLLDRTDRREVKLTPDYRGFAIGNDFVVGYGLDDRGDLRHLPFIAVQAQTLTPPLSLKTGRGGRRAPKVKR